MRTLTNAKIVNYEGFGEVIKKGKTVLLPDTNFENYTDEQLELFMNEYSITKLLACSSNDFNGYLERIMLNEKAKMKNDIEKNIRKKMNQSLINKLINDDTSISVFIENGTEYYSDKNISSLRDINLERDYEEII